MTKAKQGASAAFGPVLRAIWNKAQQTQAGIQLKAGTQAEATNIRQRLYKLRSAEDANVKRISGPEYSGPWMDLRIVIRPDEVDPEVFWLWITRDNILLGDLEIKDLATGKSLEIDPLAERLVSPGTPLTPVNIQPGKVFTAKIDSPSDPFRNQGEDE